MKNKENYINSINNSLINKTSTILKNKKIISSQKKIILTKTIKISNAVHNTNVKKKITKKNVSHDLISFNKLKDTEQKIIKKAYALIKKDIYLKKLEEKFNIKWTEDNINIL